MRRTVIALMARSVDIELAERLAGQGWTLANLQQASQRVLQDLGLTPQAISNTLKGARPPIPSKNVAKVLYRNRFQCCVCRDPEKNIILHHIKPWAVSRDHDAENLAVLCLQHHAAAHTTTTLAQNLDERALKDFKRQWEADCERFDAEAILAASRLDHAAWLYFNHQRLLALADEMRIDLPTTNGYARAFHSGVIDAQGAPVSASKSFYLYQGGDGLLLYAYMRDVLHIVMHGLTIIDMSNYLDRGLSQQIVAPGDFIFVQGAHVFKKLNKKEEGPGQISSGSRQANGVRVEYVFDRWEATSTSAWGAWLFGRQRVGSFVHVKSVERADGVVVIQGTILGISNGHATLKDREYAPEVGRLVAERLRLGEDEISAWDDDEPED
jgi:hypothetical protein